MVLMSCAFFIFCKSLDFVYVYLKIARLFSLKNHFTSLIVRAFQHADARSRTALARHLPSAPRFRCTSFGTVGALMSAARRSDADAVRARAELFDLCGVVTFISAPLVQADQARV